MKLRRVLAVGAFAIALLGIAGRGQAESTDAISLFDAYLAGPTPARAQALVAALSAAGKSMETAQALSDPLYDRLPKIEPQIASGSPDALSIGWALTKIADGGFLEDVDRALGEALASDPRASLTAFAAAVPNPTPQACECEFAAMLPLTLAETAAAHESEINRRISAVASVRDPALAQYRGCIIKALEAFRSEVRRWPAVASGSAVGADEEGRR